MQIRLDYLIAVAEEQNVTRAAKRLFISQPALTKYINQVEEYFGVRIFDRSRNPVTLTDAGNYLLREQGKIETEQMKLRRRLEMMSSNRVRITIGTGFGRGEAWIPEILRDFCPCHPEVDIRLRCCGELELMDLLTSGKVDLAVGTCDFSSGLVVSRTLQTENLRLAIPLSFGLFPEGFDAQASVDTPFLLQPEQLNGLPYIAPDENMGSFASYQTLLHQHGVRFGRLISSNSSSAIRGMVKAGLGYAYLSVNSMRIWLNREGQPLVGFATLPGLSLQRSCNYGYLPGHPNLTYLEELSKKLTDVVVNLA
jgi:DNA-binding transcriptional LysR family regulator